MTNTNVQLSAVVVAYNSAHLLAACIEPLREGINAGLYELIVVDNASHDDPSGVLDATGIAHRFVRSGSNAGFAHAVNIGNSHASGEYVLLLNPDVEFEPGVVEHLVTRMQRDRAIAAIAPLLLTEGVAAANGGRLPTAGAMFAHASGLARLLAATGKPWGHYAFTQARAGDVAVEWLSGGFVIVRRSMAPDDALLSERWFMYAEDIDLSMYLARSGRLVIDTNVTADHAIGGSSGGDERPRTMWVSALQDLHRQVLSRSFIEVAAWKTAFFLGFSARALLLLMKRDVRRARAMLVYARASLRPRPEDVARIDNSILPISVR